MCNEMCNVIWCMWRVCDVNLMWWVMWCVVKWCDVIWCDVTSVEVMRVDLSGYCAMCCMLWCVAMYCNVLECDAMQCHSMLCDLLGCDVIIKGCVVVMLSVVIWVFCGGASCIIQHACWTYVEGCMMHDVCIMLSGDECRREILDIMILWYYYYQYI